MVSAEEREIMKQVYTFLSDHNDPPKKGADGEQGWWQKTVDDMTDLCKKFGNHELMVHELVGIVEYLENKAGYYSDRKVMR